jgi:hypothetical protein
MSPVRNVTYVSGRSEITGAWAVEAALSTQIAAQELCAFAAITGA